MALGIIIILLLSMLNIFLIYVAPSTLNTNYRELLAEKPYTISLSKLKGCFWGGEISRTCWTDRSDPHSPLACFNSSYKICKLYLATTKLTLPLTLLTDNSSEKALIVPESDSSYHYDLTLTLSIENVEVYEFTGFGDGTLHYVPVSLFSKVIPNAWSEIMSYARIRFGPLSFNHAAVSFRRKVSMLLLNSFGEAWYGGKGPLPFKPMPLIIFMFNESSSITLLYSDWNGDRFFVESNVLNIM